MLYSKVVDREEADGLTWQVRSSGVLGTPGVETTTVNCADATLIGVTWDTRVRELVLRPCREVGGKETIALPVTAQTARSVAESLSCYGIDERLAKRVAAEFIVEAQHQCSDLTLPFYAAMASMLALVEAKATPVGGDAVVVPWIGWSAGLPNGVPGRNLAFAGLHENQRADLALLSAFAKEGGDLLYVTEDHELDFIAAFDPIRGAGPVSDPLVAAGNGVWRLRASSVVFQTLPLWGGFGRRWAKIRAVDAAIDAGRDRIANRPTLILSGICESKKYFWIRHRVYSNFE